ncbi:helix-hairpin-helix domain-containing protein [Vallitalea sp.]|jgi:competence protein ComEA|uniref:helix-hairpin-helix domain-containing protein n=1 Tax=Vallitalea sp. TaxID=1882829 RepID=UPI0025DB971F|nr:helix-hairpin-helix domain-containing protein [Vallitalea sp.]MCT4687167.1 helix-hairpin-helix domain-containing protein [Vallitalea sp.]
MKNKWYYGAFILLVIVVGIIYVNLESSVSIEVDKDTKDNVENNIGEEDNNEEYNTDEQDNEEKLDKTIYVHICGEVVNEGVYTVKEDSRVYEVLELAGGLTEEAATDYVNLARQVKDGEKIIFPSKEQMENGEFSVEDTEKLVNINTASIEKLTTLSGIGESRAKLIIDYREEHGDFETIEDIMKVSGIKEGAYNKIKDSIIVK